MAVRDSSVKPRTFRASSRQATGARVGPDVINSEDIADRPCGLNNLGSPGGGVFGLIVSVLLSIIYAFACAATLLERLAGRTLLLPAAEAFAFVDIDDTIRATYGYAKKGAGYGYSKVKGIQRADRDDHDPGGGAGDRREQAAEGSTNSARGVARLVADALATATRAGVDGLTILRADSAYYDHDVIAAVPVDPLTWFCQGPSVVLGMSRASAARRNHA